MHLHADRAFSSQDGRFAVVLTSGVISRMLSECRRAGSKETGGILAGRYTDDLKTAVVTHLSGPPSDSKAGGFWLVRGVKGLREWLAGLWTRSAAHYQGEWHFHPHANPSPSFVDRRQLWQISRAANYQCGEPILVVLGGDPDARWTLSVSVFEKSGAQHALQE